MTYYRGIASDPRFDDTTRAEAARRYSEEKATLDQAFNRKYEMWKDAYTKKRDYELNDPAHRLTLEQANLANVKAIRDLEGEGFLPLTPAELAGLPKMPEGQVVYKNRRGELKFGPTPPASTTINIDQKAQGKGLEELQKEMAKVFVDQFKEGIAASDDVRTLNEMRVLAGRIDTGLGPVVQSTLGKIGIKTEGLSEIQAYNALINRITPQQRVPGTGATSDFDATMFKNSIPALVNTRDGNMLIMNTMEGLANNKLARAQIAGKVISNQIDIAQGTKEMLQLQAEARALSDRVKEHVEKSGVKLPEPILKGPEDAAAWDWLKANPDHPKAPEIRKRLGL